MLKLIGTKPLYMWQQGRMIYVEVEDTKWVEFAHDGDKLAQRVEVEELNEMPVAEIPNIFLQSEERIRVWFVGADGNTIAAGILHPIWRNQPADYVYTETEIRSYEDLAERISQLSEEIEDLKENGSGGEGASLDVQIDGKSIVENGVATIPMASKDSFGVSKMFPTNDKNVPGVGISGNGVLGIVQATNANIDKKTTSKPITPSNLDYAIKSGLTTNALEWTEEEKASARDRLGALSNFKLLGEVNITEEVAEISFDGFEVDDIYVYTKGLKTNKTSSVGCFLSFNDLRNDTNPYTLADAMYTSNVFNAITEQEGFALVTEVGNGYKLKISTPKPDMKQNLKVMNPFGTLCEQVGKITKVTIVSSEASSYPFSGGLIRLFGR